MKRRTWLLTDLVVLEQQCNSNCKYCLTNDSKLKEEHITDRTEDGKIKFVKEDARAHYGEGKPLKRDLDSVIERMHDYFDPVWLIMSGGEIFLTENIIEFIEHSANCYPVVEVLTNGTLLDETIVERLSKIKNLHMSVTLDGHTLALDGCRATSQEVVDQVLKGIDLLQQYGIPTEVFSVITKYNCRNYIDFVEYLMKYDNLKIFCFPVRGHAMENFFPSEEDIKGFEPLITNYEKYSKVLLPKPYLKQMYTFMQNPKRERRCYLPFLTGQVFHDGVFTPCPFAWTNELFNILKAEKEDVIRIAENNSMLRMIDTDRIFLPYCKGCFNHLDLINLFIDGDISLEEMQSISLFKEPAILNRLIEIKQILNERNAKKAETQR